MLLSGIFHGENSCLYVFSRRAFYWVPGDPIELPGPWGLVMGRI